MPDPPPIDLRTRLALRPPEAAAALGVSENFLRGLDIPAIRDGRVVLYPIDALRDWLAERAGLETDQVVSAVTEILDSID